jgi:predicted amidophosphoribosyltransferase
VTARARDVTNRPRWRTLARGLADLLLPRACACCRSLLEADATGLVCAPCWSRCERFPEPSCRRCGHPRQPLPGARLVEGIDGGAADGAGDGFARCRWCDRLPATVRAVRSAARLDAGSAGQIVHALKYGGWTGLATEMGARMARLTFPADVVAERVALVPIPLAPVRERERGFNQSRLLADAVAQHWGVPVWPDVLVRVRATATQTRLTPSDRAANVSGAFGTDPGVTARLRGTHLVLVDDVITTAATLNAAASALTGRGVRLVSYLTFGRAPDAGDRSFHVSDPD